MKWERWDAMGHTLARPLIQHQAPPSAREMVTEEETGGWAPLRATQSFITRLGRAAPVC